MARRRLLSILAASALFTAAFAGPAAAIDLVEETQESLAEATEEALSVTTKTAEETTKTTVEAVADTADTVDAEPVTDVTNEVEKTVAPKPEPKAESQPEPAPSEKPAARSSSDPSKSDSELVAAARDVAAAPSLAFLTGSGGRAPASHFRTDLPLAAPAVAQGTSTTPTSTSVEAPQIAPPAEVATPEAPSVLAQAASSVVDEQGLPVIVLVALGSLLAAGSATVREARVTANA